MLTCYLDDSGKDPQNSLTSVAGFVARDEQWAEFEAAVEPHFKEFNVRLLHSVDLYHTEGEFKGWPLLKKQFFCWAPVPRDVIKGNYRADDVGSQKLI
jgi:hypothetical protein